jgi:predicted nucleic acid-binding protein
MILVDANVILDVFNDDPAWAGWSSHAIEQGHQDEGLAINATIYAEVSIQFDEIEELKAALPAEKFRRLILPYEAAFLAGKAYKQYRQRGGARRSPLPDFFIGAHAQAAGLTLLTRDKNRYATYFPNVRLISP